jgi:adenylosuccinate synthase
VSGKSGPLNNEIDWETLRKEADSNEDMTEYTSCTNRVRRVARFDAEIVNRSIECNRPNIIVLNHVDYFLDYKMRLFLLINAIQEKINGKINYIGTDVHSLIETSSIKEAINEVYK